MKELKIYKNTYIDSVTLMSSTSKFKKLFEVNDLVMLMATAMNVDMIQSVGFDSDELKNVGPSDLVIAIDHHGENSLLDEVYQLLTNPEASKSSSDVIYNRLEEVDSAYNMVVISVAGQYAAYEAQKALEQNRHVMMFSDNVSIEDEINLKKLAISKNLLMMGPDCGTAIINGVGLAFANNIRAGQISLVAASGTGLQEVTVLIDQLGEGIRQAIGVGGRDLSTEVGGLMMSAALDAVINDDETKIIVVISKPPAHEVEKKILDQLMQQSKPVVVCFLDSDKNEQQQHLHFVITLSDAAMKAVSLLGREVSNLNQITTEDQELIMHAKRMLPQSSKYLKGLYCGGTLTAEALSLLRNSLPGITSNVAKRKHEKMKNPRMSDGHNLVDLGDDIFTNGRPHPMIEPTIRLERILEEAKNPETGVILLDFELGYGSHEDPVGITIDTIVEAKEIAREMGKELVFVAYVMGTPSDKQDKSAAENMLRERGVIVARTNAHAAAMVSQIIGGELND